mmetsp:Transcript_4180/g.9098  ORF Transcript_4180/g.9098 Transcript_4180/m.9098 type:complete len:455 (-) Transcript_4180:162-1526(-)|eukprot:CAMPEP_0201127324 /NCGR_PEP_ID=MMETSP0850-20130426/29861_1 /ASSEMBLY_ACC=CAM_ASM_000622 /TAXON_ID=183588 /ORGANISM="Pseudo-nitzschia fraudulenta, Strain WWA7" /LENGTH=454 /DNA_ID=CAMNT_0047396151 /DNA_START=45 /DNA_END=1409 /DNA_ORIENTATION=+
MSAATSGVDGSNQQEASHAWEASTNAWENAVQEDADGRIIVAGGDTTADIIRKRRKRLEQNDYAQRNRRVVRDMIRYVYVLIDCSRWARQKDQVLGGTKLDVTMQLLQEFIQEYYDQNPLSHLGFVTLKGGEAEVLTNLSSSSKTHKLALKNLAKMGSPPTGGGEFSLQNGLEVAGRSLGHQPRHGSREILIVCGALSTCDPGHILTETLPRLMAANIRVSTFALSAELHICRKIAEVTGGAMGVCLDKGHMKDWLLEQCVPPPAIRKEILDYGCEMVQMGFPTRTKSEIPTLVHATRDTKLLARTAYTCPQCRAKIQELPADCVVCGLKLVLSPHLARSFHHLFPVAPFAEIRSAVELKTSIISSSKVIPYSAPSSAVLDSKLRLSTSTEATSCFACLRLIGIPSQSSKGDGEDEGEETLRFKCPECKNVFCVNCDSFLHDALHNCPGCLQLS